MHIHPCAHSSYKQTVRSEWALHYLGLNVFPGCFQMLSLKQCIPFLGRKSGIMEEPESWGVVHCNSAGAQWLRLMCWLQAALPACPDCSPVAGGCSASSSCSSKTTCVCFGLAYPVADFILTPADKPGAKMQSAAWLLGQHRDLPWECVIMWFETRWLYLSLVHFSISFLFCILWGWICTPFPALA